MKWNVLSYWWEEKSSKIASQEQSIRIVKEMMLILLILGFPVDLVRSPRDNNPMEFTTEFNIPL